jgi:L-malate glycosyltransferase
MKVLHITAHLGGGVGRVLSRVSMARKKGGSDVTDSFICLEPPEKKETVSSMHEAGIEVFICPDSSQIDRLIAESDIVQLEWWHHPLLARFICENTIPARLIVWSHTSGLSYPDIPLKFVYMPHSFLFTSPVSHQNVRRAGGIDTVHSSGGFEDIPLNERRLKKGDLTYSYLGAPNFSKLHPQIADFLGAVHTPGFRVQFFGDANANPKLLSTRLADKIVLRGFTSNPDSVLMESDVLIYLLNPDHYGTTENALLEAMAAGVVPVVLNNPVEASIVKHNVMGMIVDSAESFADAIAFLNQNRGALRNMARAASKAIRERFPLGKTIQGLDAHYRMIMKEEKSLFTFSSVFGSCPHEWFLSCIGKYGKYFTTEPGDGLRHERLQHPVLYEQSKSSAFQFFNYFPQDKMLERWVSMLREDLHHENADPA